MKNYGEDKFKAELGFFGSLRTGINNALQEFVDFKNEKKFVNLAKKLYEKYNLSYLRVNDLLEFDAYKGLQYVSRPRNDEDSEEWYSVLYVILPECDKAIEGLKAKISPPSPNLTLRLNRLKERIFNFTKCTLNMRRKKQFTMNHPIVWLIFSLILLIISYFIYKALK